MALCDVTWPLLDPNEEDRRFGRTHHCVRDLFHLGDHRCLCGETLPWDVSNFSPSG